MEVTGTPDRDQPPSSVTDLRRDYRIAEYQALIGKMDRAARDLHIAEVTFAAAIGLFYAWVFKDGLELATTGRWILVVPVILAFLAATRLWARFTYIGRVANYIADVEYEMFGDVTPNGWERRYRDETAGAYIGFRVGTWIVALVLTTCVLCFAPLPTRAHNAQGQPVASSPG